MMQFIPHKSKTAFWGMTGLFLIIGIFAISRFMPLWTGASIRVQGLENGDTMPGSFALSGRAKHASELYINDYNVPVDSSGNFSSTLNLPAGYTVLTVEAVDRFGNDTKETYRVLVRDESPGPTLGLGETTEPITN